MKLEQQVTRNSYEYKRVHKWLVQTFGRPQLCVNPSCKHTSKKYEWAKRKDRTYAMKRGHFIRLCTSCHRAYDMTAERKAKTSRTLKGRPFTSEHRRNLSLALKGNRHAVRKTSV
jgi:hypothetical protein